MAYIEQKKKEWPRHSPEFWQDLETLLPNVTEFEFTGGEPFLISEHFDVLEKAVELGVSQQIDLHYNTNGTVWPQQAHIWKHFNRVEIAFSIDNIGEKFELERSGANWNQLLATIVSAREFFSVKRIQLQACVTVSVYNILDLPEICAWMDQQHFDSVYLNLLHDPWYLNISRMTDQAKARAAEKLSVLFDHEKFGDDIKQIVAFMQAGVSSDGKEFCSVVKDIDIVRKEDFSRTHRDIARAMNYGS